VVVRVVGLDCGVPFADVFDFGVVLDLGVLVFFDLVGGGSIAEVLNGRARFLGGC